MGEYKNDVDIWLYFCVFQWEKFMFNIDDLLTKYSRPQLQGHKREYLCRYKRASL
jgi:hypothetical protein